VCGGEVVEEGHPLAGIISTKPSLSCGVSMETQFFSCSLAGRNTAVCGVCGLAEAELLAPPADMVATYSRVEKLCTDCKAAGHTHLCGKKKPNTAAAAERAAKRQRQKGVRAVQQAPRGRGDLGRGRGQGRG
jgi:hypothetical protein